MDEVVSSGVRREPRLPTAVIPIFVALLPRAPKNPLVECFLIGGHVREDLVREEDGVLHCYDLAILVKDGQQDLIHIHQVVRMADESLEATCAVRPRQPTECSHCVICNAILNCRFACLARVAVVFAVKRDLARDFTKSKLNKLNEMKLYETKPN